MVQTPKNVKKIKKAGMMSRKRKEMREAFMMLNTRLNKLMNLPSFGKKDQFDELDILHKTTMLIEYAERHDAAGRLQEALLQLEQAPSEQALRDLMTDKSVEFNKVSDNKSIMNI